MNGREEMPEPCQHCGVLDALGRHDGGCAYALKIGLPRLADGEDPIPPGELGTAVEVRAETQGEAEAQNGPVGHAPPDREAYERLRGLPPATAPSQATRPPDPVPGVGSVARPYASAELWLSWVEEGDYFDATVFASELEALRHAVREGHKVARLELGKSLREQLK